MDQAISATRPRAVPSRQVSPRGSRPRTLLRALLLLLGLASATTGADLQPRTAEAFERYARLVEAEFASENAGPGPFLAIDRLPPDRRAATLRQLAAGQVVVERLDPRDGGRSVAVPGGMIHHWTGTVFIPGVTLAAVLGFEQDYDHQAPYFQPDVVVSKILGRSGDDFTVHLRFYKKQILSVVLDTEHQVHYARIDRDRAWSQSWATRIEQVDHAGQAGERLEPAGHDDGFLWRMNTYWRFEARDGGVFVESQSVSLTRDIPTGLGWMVGPLVTSIPRESLAFTLAATRRAIVERGRGPLPPTREK